MGLGRGPGRFLLDGEVLLGQLGDGGNHPAVGERGHRCRGLRWVKEMLALNVAVDDAGGWQAERYQRGETGQRPGYTGNPFRPR